MISKIEGKFELHRKVLPAHKGPVRLSYHMVQLVGVSYLYLAKIPSGRKKSAILEMRGSFGGDFRLGTGCSAITDRREDSSECVAKDWKTHFSRKLWATIMKDV